MQKSKLCKAKKLQYQQTKEKILYVVPHAKNTRKNKHSIHSLKSGLILLPEKVHCNNHSWNHEFTPVNTIQFPFLWYIAEHIARLFYFMWFITYQRQWKGNMWDVKFVCVVLDFVMNTYVIKILDGFYWVQNLIVPIITPIYLNDINAYKQVILPCLCM